MIFNKTTKLTFLTAILITAIAGICLAATVNLSSTMSGGQAGDRKLYWNVANNPETIDNAHNHAHPNYTKSSNFTLTVPVKLNDYVQVKFSGCVTGDVYMALWAQGPYTEVNGYTSEVFGASKRIKLYRPFCLTKMIRATADGTITIYMEFFKEDLNLAADAPVIVSGRVMTAQILKNVTRSGTNR